MKVSDIKAGTVWVISETGGERRESTCVESVCISPSYKQIECDHHDAGTERVISEGSLVQSKIHIYKSIFVLYFKILN